MRRTVKYFIACLMVTARMLAQDVLTVEDAIKIALEKNYSVMIMKNQKEIAKAQNNIGAAGMSPTVSLNAGVSSSNLNSYQVFNTGAVQDRAGAKASGFNGSINADWIVFDGLRMFAIKKRLSLNEDVSELALKQQMENTIYDVIAAYYNIVRVNEMLKAAGQNLQIYEERRKIAQVRQEIGSDSKVEVLLSKSDENRARSAIIQLELELLNSKTQLNTLLGRAIDIDFKAADSIVVNYSPGIEELKKNVSAGNTSLLIAKQNERIAGESVKEARSARLPFITLNSSYILTKTQSQAGFLFSNRQNGLNLGLTGRWLLFNGGRTDRLVKEKNLQALNQRLLTDQTAMQVDALVYVNYQSFLLNKKIVDMELQNLADSKEVQSISLERYRIGKANLLETIETQKNLEDAQVRYFDALYNMKLAEADLLRVNGSLVK
jgi:outer membrane protein TolC